MAEKKQQAIRVTKFCSRQVSLKGVTSQYDNIRCGNTITTIFEVSSQEELNTKLSKMTSLVQNETERDVREEMIKIFAMAKDPKNSALVGLGPNIDADIDALIARNSQVEEDTQVEEVAEKKPSKKKIKEEELSISDLEEVDLESLDL